jgi:DNA ligase 1
MGYTDAKMAPSAARYAALLSAHADGDAGQPYPFFLAHALDGEADSFEQRLGAPGDWLVEWKYDGIRAQLVRRAGQCWIWSRGEELVTEAFPEVVALASTLPEGTVLDGEILVWLNDAPAPFQRLQQRIGRKTLSKKVLAESPVSFMAYDLLEWQGQDLRDTPQHSRRALLEQVCSASALPLSPQVTAPSWAELAALRQHSRARGVEGFMLKHRDTAYGSGRTKAGGVWWKWKIDPLSVDCVLIYAQAGHGRRASVYTDYTFAVWNRAPQDAAEARAVVDAITRREPALPGALQLVPFAKAYSGLSDAEFVRVDRIIRADTLEKFGPVRSVKPSLVFELGFEAVNRSPRHKSGIAVRFPRMLRIRDDKPLHEADTLATLQAMLKAAD